jgi:hypothetical protein
VHVHFQALLDTPHIPVPQSLQSLARLRLQLFKAQHLPDWCMPDARLIVIPACMTCCSNRMKGLTYFPTLQRTCLLHCSPASEASQVGHPTVRVTCASECSERSQTDPASSSACAKGGSNLARGTESVTESPSPSPGAVHCQVDCSHAQGDLLADTTRKGSLRKGLSSCQSGARISSSTAINTHMDASESPTPEDRGTDVAVECCRSQERTNTKGACNGTCMLLDCHEGGVDGNGGQGVCNNRSGASKKWESERHESDVIQGACNRGRHAGKNYEACRQLSEGAAALSGSGKNQNDLQHSSLKFDGEEVAVACTSMLAGCGSGADRSEQCMCAADRQARGPGLWAAHVHLHGRPQWASVRDSAATAKADRKVLLEARRQGTLANAMASFAQH